MLKPKRISIRTYWEDERPNAEAFRYVHFMSEPYTWVRLHRNIRFSRQLMGTGNGFQIIEWVD